MRQLLFHLLSLVLLVLVMAGLLELFVRAIRDDGMQYDLEMWKYARHGKQVALSPEIGHEHVPGARFKAMGVDIAINEHGMRNGPIKISRPPGTFRILMVGDSLIFGWGVPVEDTVSERLERALNAAQVNTEVLNTGIGNTNTSMQVAAFLERWHAFKPDLVILNYFINDAEKTPVYGRSTLFDRKSYAWTYFKSRLDILLRMASAKKGWENYYRDLYGDGGGWPVAQAAIKTLADYCNKQGIRLAVVNYPELRQLKDYPFAEVTAKVRTTARANALPFLDLLPSVDGEDPASLWVSTTDPHPNAKANRLFATRLFEWLGSQGLVPIRDGRLVKPGAG